MKTFNFKADNGKQLVDGVLVIGKNKSEIIFDNAIKGFEDTVIQERNIKDVYNFIGALFARFDYNEYFNTVKVGRKDVPILREKEETTETVFVQGDGLHKTVLSSNTVDTTDIFGNTVSVSIDVKEVVIPKNFSYTKDETLNRILKANVVPADYNREINNRILKVVRGMNTGKVKKDMVMLDKYGHGTISEKYAFIFIDKRMIS